MARHNILVNGMRERRHQRPEQRDTAILMIQGKAVRGQLRAAAAAAAGMPHPSKSVLSAELK